MIVLCRKIDFKDIYEIINDAAFAYKGIIPADQWHEPYMSEQELQSQIDDGVEFWCYFDDQTIIGVMGSAFHGALFDLSPEACRNVVYLTEKISSANNSRILTFIIIDILKSLNSTYISAIDGTEYPWKARVESAAIDLETTLRGLRELDLL